MIMCVLLCYPVSIRIYYQQGGLFLVYFIFRGSLQAIKLQERDYTPGLMGGMTCL